MFETPVSGSRRPAAEGAARNSVPATGDVIGAPAVATASGAHGTAGAVVPAVEDFAASLSGVEQDVPEAELIDRIAALEVLKSAAAAAQARATAAFDATRRRQHRQRQSDATAAAGGATNTASSGRAGTAVDASSRAGKPAGKPAEGVVSEIALARRGSPVTGNRHLNTARALVDEMPHTLHALTIGVLSEWRATILVRETACLSTADRSAVDAAVAADPAALEGLGDRRLISEAKKETYRLDPASVVRRAAKAASERRVTCRPAPDTMTYVTGLLPVAQGVAIQAALTRAADHLIRIAGDERGRGQIMADTLVERVTGRTMAPIQTPAPAEASTSGTAERTGAAEPVGPSGQDGTQAQPQGQEQGQDGNGTGPGAAGRGMDIEVQLIMTDRALFAGDHEPAHLHGYGPVPAEWARNLIQGQHGNTGNEEYGPAGDGTGKPATAPEAPAAPAAPDGDGTAGVAGAARMWLRRLYTEPGTGRLIGMDSTARIFPPGLRRFIISRDQTCLTPWCDAPIRHIDHITDHHAGGHTSESNGQGLCERCNMAKTAPGFTAKAINGARHTTRTTTPTGHTYQSTAPPPPGTERPATWD